MARIEEIRSGVFAVAEPAIDDHDDKRTCAACGHTISYARAAKRLTDGAIIHLSNCLAPGYWN